MKLDWSTFDYPAILREARSRCADAQGSTASAITEEMRTLSYWIAWVTHANAIAIAGTDAADL